MTTLATLGMLGSGFLFIVAIYASVRTPMLRDQSVQANPPFSFSRCQAMWWSVIVLASLVLVAGFAGELPTLNLTCAALLGISFGTTATAGMIDATDTSNPSVVRHQDLAPSQAFLVDILSDENGPSVHRFQALVLNVTFGVAFLLHVRSLLGSADAFPNYTEAQLSLLGVSSAAYVALKMNENKSVPVTAGTIAVLTTSDELLDPDPPAAREQN